MNTRIWLATLVCVAAAPVASGQQADDITLLREGNRGSRDAIRTLHAQFRTETRIVLAGAPVSPPQTVSVEWWQDGEQIRWQEQTTVSSRGSNNKTGPVTVIMDRAVRDGKLTVLEHQDRPGSPPYRGALVADFDPAEPTLGNLWKLGLFLISSRPRITLPELLQRHDCIKNLAKEDLGGRQVYKLDLALPLKDPEECQVWVDPAHNFLVQKIAFKGLPEGTRLREEKEVLSFRECEPGVYFPQEVETRTYAIADDKSQQLYAIGHTHFESVVVNKALDAKIFDLAIPPGTPTINRQEGTSFVMGDNGTPRGPISPAPAITPPPSPQLTPEQHLVTGPRLVVSIAVSLTLGLLVTLFLYWRRRRLRAASP